MQQIGLIYLESGCKWWWSRVSNCWESASSAWRNLNILFVYACHCKGLARWRSTTYLLTLIFLILATIRAWDPWSHPKSNKFELLQSSPLSGNHVQCYFSMLTHSDSLTGNRYLIDDRTMVLNEWYLFQKMGPHRSCKLLNWLQRAMQMILFQHDRLPEAWILWRLWYFPFQFKYLALIHVFLHCNAADRLEFLAFTFSARQV